MHHLHVKPQALTSQSLSSQLWSYLNSVTTMACHHLGTLTARFKPSGSSVEEVRKTNRMHPFFSLKPRNGSHRLNPCLVSQPPCSTPFLWSKSPSEPNPPTMSTCVHFSISVTPFHIFTYPFCILHSSLFLKNLCTVFEIPSRPLQTHFSNSILQTHVFLSLPLKTPTLAPYLFSLHPEWSFLGPP